MGWFAWRVQSRTVPPIAFAFAIMGSYAMDGTTSGPITMFVFKLIGAGGSFAYVLEQQAAVVLTVNMALSLFTTALLKATPIAARASGARGRSVLTCARG
jgi:hypothetical protein